MNSSSLAVARCFIKSSASSHERKPGCRIIESAGSGSAAATVEEEVDVAPSMSEDQRLSDLQVTMSRDMVHPKS